LMLMEKLLQVSGGKNIFELLAQKGSILHHHGSPLMR